MALFKKSNAENPAYAIPKSERNYNNAYNNILIVVCFSFINIFMMIFGADSYFLFSAYVPYTLVTVGMYNTGSLPAEYYDQTVQYEFWDKSFLIEMIVAAVVILALYMVCYFLARKKKGVGGLVVATVLFSLDTVLMLTLNGIQAEMLLDIVFHIVIVVSLIYGIISFKKMKKEKEEAENAALYQGEFVPTTPEGNTCFEGNISEGNAPEVNAEPAVSAEPEVQSAPVGQNEETSAE